MRTSDRTMLEKCGFSDPDRKETMHDAACAYIAANSLELCRRLVSPEIHKSTPILEYPITKGSGHYKTTMGFADVVCRHNQGTIGIEVKWLRCSVSEATRQIALYQEHTRECYYLNAVDTWCLAAPWPINLEEKRILDSRLIIFVRLDEGKIREFSEQQRSVECATEVSI